MTRLVTLRSRLNQLRRQRLLVRHGAAFSSLLLAVLWIIALAFLIDFLFEMNRPQRFVSLIFCAGALWWAHRRFVRPWLGRAESELDMALLVERQQGIDTDLVAALQFESTSSEAWGSRQLTGAVINYVAEFSPGLNVFEGFSYRDFVRRLSALAVTLIVILSAVLLYPAHAAAFFNRFLLGSAHYPTKTIIEEIRINDVVVFPGDEGTAVRQPYGRPIRFEVRCSGELPEMGLVQLTGRESGLSAEIELQPRDPASVSAERTLVGELPRLVDSVSYQLYVGDAWTDPRSIELIPLPIVLINLTPQPPEYARAVDAALPTVSAGARQIAVIEGSDVDLQLESSNKELQRAVVMIDNREYPLVSASEDRRTWSLPIEGTPFEQVGEPFRYEIQVEDVDGLGLEKPIQGYVRLKTDRPPRVAAGMVSRRVVPTASPRIAYGAVDDYGLSHILVHLQIVRRDGSMHESSRRLASIPPEDQPRTVLRGDYRLELESLNLVKGDELKVTLEAFDYRGELPPKSTVSEPLILQITDREGILATLLESDEKSARQLDAIIQRELGIGETQ